MYKTIKSQKKKKEIQEFLAKFEGDWKDSLMECGK